jgi:hypothetical protein
MVEGLGFHRILPGLEGPRGEGPRGEGPRGEGPRGEAPRGEAPRGPWRGGGCVPATLRRFSLPLRSTCRRRVCARICRCLERGCQQWDGEGKTKSAHAPQHKAHDVVGNRAAPDVDVHLEVIGLRMVGHLGGGGEARETNDEGGGGGVIRIDTRQCDT